VPIGVGHANHWLCLSPAASTGRSSPREPGVWVPGDAAGPRGGSGAEDPTDPSPVPW
uniref:Uncharacterized protein n=1 Tax=Ursus americanus TaxID=9643 RepID=A0A452RR83_URSAM